ncbi:MAG: hypothetical protein AAGK32_05915, partial [Actinomycetota bacterium]
RPPPLSVPMHVERGPDGLVTVGDPDGEVASGRPVDPIPTDAVPEVPHGDLDAAVAAYLDAADTHPFRTCFVCGPDRDPGDGLRIFSGPIGDEPGVVAAPWTPDPSLADTDGSLDERAVWSALDCAGGFAHIFHDRSCVLGRLAVDIVGPVEIGTTYTVVGWADPADGRKLPAHTAVIDPSDGSVPAVGRSTWIEVDPADFT